MSRPAAFDSRALKVVVCAALIVTLAMGVRQAFGLFLRPVSMDLDIGRQDFGLAIALSNLLFGLAQPFVGAWSDRWGSGRITAAFAVLYVLGLGLMAAATTALGLHASMGLLVGLALSGTTFVVVLGAVARTVAPEKRSLAFGLVTAGGSLGQFLVVPFAQAALDGLDWRGALLVLAGLVALIIPLAFGVAGRPVAPPPSAEKAMGAWDALREASGARSYWLLNAGFFVCGFHIAFVATHMPAYLKDEGLSAAVGAGSLALIGLFNIAGSWLFGAWGGKHSKKRLLSVLYASRALAILVFIAVPLSPLTALAFSAVFGFLWLGTVPLTSGLVAQIWGVRHLSTLYGVVFLSHQVGSFLGAWLAGLAFDLQGSYLPVWIASIGLGLLAAAVNWPVDERPTERLRAATA